MPRPSEPAPPEPEQWGVTPSEARQLLLQQMCPVCGRGPWKSPLNHAALKHGIGKFTMRNICDLKIRESVADPAFSAFYSDRAKARDMTPLHEAHKKGHGKYRVTREGKRRKAAGSAGNLDGARSKAYTPEALRKRSESFRRTWDAKTPEQQQVTLDRLYEAKRPSFFPCGTVASYGRGCRCDECRTAHTEYRRARRIAAAQRERDEGGSPHHDSSRLPSAPPPAAQPPEKL